MKPTPKRGPGRPKTEPTVQIRAYAADVPKLAKRGRTQAEAVRGMLAGTIGTICVSDDSAVEITLQRANDKQIKDAGMKVTPLDGKWYVVADDGKTLTVRNLPTKKRGGKAK